MMYNERWFADQDAHDAQYYKDESCWLMCVGLYRVYEGRRLECTAMYPEVVAFKDLDTGELVTYTYWEIYKMNEERRNNTEWI